MGILKVENKAIFIYFCHNLELISQKLKVFRVSLIFYMKRLQNLQSVVGKKQTWCWRALQPISTMLVAFKTFNVQSFSRLRERLEGQTGVGPTSLLVQLSEGSSQSKLIVIIYLRVFLERKINAGFCVGINGRFRISSKEAWWSVVF